MADTISTGAARPRGITWLRWFALWRRNALFWRRLATPSLIGNFGEPILYLLALGYGLGVFVGEIDGMQYIAFLGSGIICSSAMTSATFEALYSAYTRMAIQNTWDAVITTPLEVHDVIIGEIAWAGTKGFINSVAILIVCVVMGIADAWTALLAPLAALLLALCVASMAMVVTTLARGYEYFLYYTTLVMTPMFLLGGVFFPLSQMPPPVRAIAEWLPLSHAVALVRPLIIGEEIDAVARHVAVLVLITIICTLIATRIAKRRMIA